MHRTHRRALLLVAAMLLTSCAADNSPSEFGDAARVNFIEACTGELTGRASDDGVERVALGTPATCGCVYDQLADSVSYEEYEGLDSKIRDDPTRVPAEVQLAIDRCIAGPVAPATSTTAAP